MISALKRVISALKRMDPAVPGASEAQQTLNAGVEVLDGLMRSHGFVYRATAAGKSSGGRFAVGKFQRGNRILELHYRYSLGLVTYRVGHLTLSHEDYMWSVLGRRWATNYPGFSKEPLDGFQHLLEDLKLYCVDFLSCPDAAFARHVERAKTLSKNASRLP